MKTSLYNRHNHKRLLLIFSGWAMDDAWLRHELCDIDFGYDIAFVWAYNNAEPFDASILNPYDEVCVLAWSMGVQVASRLLPELGLKVTKRIAVNGAPVMVDDNVGIPTQIFEATRSNLNERNLSKFYRRVCGESYRQFAEFIPQRTLNDVATELELMPRLSNGTDITWDVAIASTDDAIFPYSNQINAWQGHCYTLQTIEGPHLPCFKSIVQAHLIDKSLVSERFTRSAQTYNDNNAAQQHVAKRLMDKFHQCAHKISSDGKERILEIGPGTGILTEKIVEAFPHADIFLWDITPSTIDLHRNNCHFELCDAEIAIRNAPNDCFGYIFSASTIQWFNSIPEFFKAASRALRKGGIMAVASYTAENMAELTSILGNGLNLPDIDTWKSYIPNDLKVLCCDTEKFVLTFDSPRQILQHLKLTGVNAVTRSNFSIAAVRAFSDNYSKDNSTQKYPLTYSPIYLILQKI